MTIATEILGRSPILYWQLDDASGPAASDSSGNGRAGPYGGSWTPHQYGVEPGSFAAQFGAGGFVQRVGLVQPGTLPFTVVWYASYNNLTTPSPTALMSNGGAGVSKGWDFRWNAVNQVSLQAWNTFATPTATPFTTVPIWAKWWHPWAISFNGTTGMSLWCDGTVLVSLTLSGTLSTVTAAETFSAVCNYPGVLAHIAYYDKLLSAADIGAIGGYRFDWPFGPMVNVTWPSPPGSSGAINPSDPVIIDLNADLADIHRAVIREYPTTPDAPPP